MVSVHHKIDGQIRENVGFIEVSRLSIVQADIKLKVCIGSDTSTLFTLMPVDHSHTTSGDYRNKPKAMCVYFHHSFSDYSNCKENY